MAKMNLLPPELAPQEKYANFARVLRRIGVISFIVYFVFIFVSFGVFFYLDTQAKDRLESQNNLKLSIEALEETEQRLLLSKDRIGHAEVILSNPNVATVSELVYQIESGRYEGVRITQYNVSPSFFEVFLGTDSSDSLERFLDEISSNYDLSQFSISGVRYFAGRAYESVLTLTI